VIRLLPPVCKDCGVSAEESALARYLDFHLCQPCLARRERAVVRPDPAKKRTEPQSAPVEEEVQVPPKRRKARSTSPKKGSGKPDKDTSGTSTRRPSRRKS